MPDFHAITGDDWKRSIKRSRETPNALKELIHKKFKFMNTEPLELDEDKYPTEAALERVKKWPYTDDFKVLMDLIHDAWAYRDWGWSQKEAMDCFNRKPIIRYIISTAGWSGNEDIIMAMQENFVFWHSAWMQVRRGGHYIFELPKEAP